MSGLKAEVWPKGGINQGQHYFLTVQSLVQCLIEAALVLLYLFLRRQEYRYWAWRVLVMV